MTVDNSPDPHASAPAPATAPGEPPAPPALKPWPVFREVLDAAVRCVRERPALFVGLGAIGAVVGVVQAGVSSLGFAPDSVPGIVSSVVLGLASAVLSVVTLGATTFAAGEYLQGRETSVGAAMRVGYRRGVPLVGVGLLVGLATMAGFLLCILPGFYIMGAFGLALPILVIEEGKIIASIQRSRELTRGNLRVVLNAMIALGLLVFAALLPLILLSAAVGGFAAAAGGGDGPPGAAIGFAGALLAAAGAVTTPFSQAGMVALFLTIRREREGAPAAALAQVFG